jgi:cell division protein FtsQ
VKARWIAARRAEGRRRLRVLIVITSVVSLAAVAWGVTKSPLLDVDHVIVRGLHHTTAAQVETAAGIHRGDALMWLDIGRGVSRLDALPYVRAARVTREWPGTVRITVTERTPVAWVEGSAGRVLVDGTGRVLDAVADPPVGIPKLQGTRTVPAPGATIAPAVGARVASHLSGYVAAGTRTITVADAGVSLELVAGPQFRLGDATQVEVKVHAGLAVLDAMAGQEVHYVDVSVPANPVAG